jgi:hypothetical protein
MERTRAENRFNSRRKALRRRRITQEVYGMKEDNPYYDNLHQYSKNKVHCSCPWCSRKSKEHPKVNDVRKNEAMNSAIEELEEDEEES